MKHREEARPLAEAFAVERVTREHPIGDLAAIVDAIDSIARASFTDAGFSTEEELGRAWARLWIARTEAAREHAAEPPPIVGFLIAWHVADELHVLNIATEPSMRRRGVARSLMDVALRYSAAEKLRLVILEVRRSNLAAIKLYRGLGFTALGVRRGYYADNGEDAIEMLLALDPVTGRALPGRDEIRIDG